MSYVTSKPFLSTYPPISSSGSGSPATKSRFPVSLRLNKSSTIYLTARLPKLSLNVVAGTSTSTQSGPVCLFGGRTKSGNVDEGIPKEVVGNFMGSLKEQSIEDVLRQQIKKKEFYDDGGSGKGGFGGRGGGGGKDGKDGSGGSEGENISDMFDEVMQAVLATLGFIFLYIYILEGEDINRYTKDIIKVMFGGKKSLRLQRLAEKWKRTLKKMSETKKMNPYWLEHAIMKTQTWYDSPAIYKKLYNDITGASSRKVTKAKKVRDEFDGEYFDDDEDEDANDDYYY
ncbi:unnamed protein product [Cuscuta epithymum]|uniref:Uncharacterized protein n=1 Tax=Cuscuta epithymum TaxID=186058 RepID=A0AAV0FKX8_9ASTE|nr:unnamed protein product [Cuscuta epithymum]CAH9135957.1 unnamed protein product [Cuscuta epithymum]